MKPGEPFIYLFFLFMKRGAGDTGLGGLKRYFSLGKEREYSHMDGTSFSVGFGLTYKHGQKGTGGSVFSLGQQTEKL